MASKASDVERLCQLGALCIGPSFTTWGLRESDAAIRLKPEIERIKEYLNFGEARKGVWNAREARNWQINIPIFKENIKELREKGLNTVPDDLQKRFDEINESIRQRNSEVAERIADNSIAMDLILNSLSDRDKLAFMNSTSFLRENDMYRRSKDCFGAGFMERDTTEQMQLCRGAERDKNQICTGFCDHFDFVYRPQQVYGGDCPEDGKIYTVDKKFKFWGLKEWSLPETKIRDLNIKYGLVMPSTLEKIREKSFYNIFSRPVGLQSIDLTKCTALKTIGPGAFSHSLIQEINMSVTKITEIESKTFESCWELHTVHLPLYLQSIGKEAFYYCLALKKIDFYNCSKLEVIEEKAFDSCKSLQEINLNSSQVLRKIGISAFKDCKRLQRVTLHNFVDFGPVLEVGHKAFIGCMDNLEVIIGRRGEDTVKNVWIKEQWSPDSFLRMPHGLKETFPKNTQFFKWVNKKRRRFGLD
tara:strand:+ start:1153 stop:2571 length:1419 start_codon:yes stop_codon:yes gene_type:complete